ncbi:MAG: NUDIX hydrolase [Myxococcales bacterium]|nr:NUDIX hydrolase [Myxococcales bacterium]|tara:strand:- start:2665 stop:3156 length:492 start_codon:yes stop_codon:yes gene_type:complete
MTSSTQAKSYRPFITVASMIEQDGRILFIKETIREKLVLNQPAGHVDEGESILEAVVRETLEETGWQVEPEALVGVYQWISGLSGRSYLRFVIACRPVHHDPSLPLDVPVQSIHWFTPEEADQLRSEFRSPMVDRALDDFLAGQRYPLDGLAYLPELNESRPK